MRFKRRGLWLHRDFLNLWAGETVSIFGTMVGSLALQFTALLSLDAGPKELALLALVGAVTRFVAAPLAGVWVDRLPRRPLMIGADLARLLALGSVPLSWWSDMLTMEQLYAVSIVLALFTVLFDIAYQAYLPSLVGREHVVEGNAKLSASASAAEIGGFGAAGWLVQVLSAPGAVAVDALSFGWSALFLARIRAGEAEKARVRSGQPFYQESVEGMKVVMGHPVVRMLTVATVLIATGQRVVGVLFLIYLVDDVGFAPGVLGIIFAVGGATSLLGAWVAGQRWFEGRLGIAMALAASAGAVGMLGMPLAQSVGIVGISFLVANQLITDPAMTFFEIHELSIRQQVAGDEVLGRVNAAVQFMALAGGLVGTGLAALLGETWDARTGLFVAFGILMLAPLVLLLSGPVRGARMAPPEVTEVVTAV